MWRLLGIGLKHDFQHLGTLDAAGPAAGDTTRSWGWSQIAPSRRYRRRLEAWPGGGTLTCTRENRLRRRQEPSFKSFLRLSKFSGTPVNANSTMQEAECNRESIISTEETEHFRNKEQNPGLASCQQQYHVTQTCNEFLVGLGIPNLSVCSKADKY